MLKIGSLRVPNIDDPKTILKQKMSVRVQSNLPPTIFAKKNVGFAVIDEYDNQLNLKNPAPARKSRFSKLIVSPPKHRPSKDEAGLVADLNQMTKGF